VNKSRQIKRLGHVAHVGEIKDAYQILVGIHEEKALHGKITYGHQNNTGNTFTFSLPHFVTKIFSAEEVCLNLRRIQASK